MAKLVGRRKEEQLLRPTPRGPPGAGRWPSSSTPAPRGRRDRGRGLLDAGRASSSASGPSAAWASRSPAAPRGRHGPDRGQLRVPEGDRIHGQGVQPTVAVAAQREEDEEPEGAPSRTRSSTRRSRSWRARRRRRRRPDLAHELLQALAGREAGPAPTGTLMASPVWGLWAARGLRRLTRNGPEVHQLHRLALLERPGHLVETPSRARSTSAFVRPVSLATRATSSALFSPSPTASPRTGLPGSGPSSPACP